MATKLNAIAFFLAVTLLHTPAFGSLIFTLSPAIEAGKTSGCIDFSGGCVVFSGTLEDDGSDDLFLNDTSVTFTPPAATFLSLDSNFFFDNVPGILCSPSDAGCPFPTSYTGPIFQIDIAPGTPPGAYFGSLTILGGTSSGDPSATDPLASQGFQVTVVPEPAAFGLALAGLAAIATRWGRRFRLPARQKV